MPSGSPGEFLVTVDALQARRHGNVRDTVLVLLPGPRVMPVFLTRAPMKFPLIEMLMKYGAGALWIDGCRVGSKASPTIDRRNTARRTGNLPISKLSAKESRAIGRICGRKSIEIYLEGRPGEVLGRWPTNTLLVHGPTCGQDICQADCPVELLRHQDPDWWDNLARDIFPQFRNVDEAMAWLHRLIHGPS